MLKFQLKSAFFFLSFVLLGVSCFALSKQPKTTPIKNKKQLIKQKIEKEKIKSSCNLSARTQKRIKSYQISAVSNFLNKKDIKELLDLHLSDIKKGWPNKCPKSCKVVNDYSVFVKSYPLSVNKNSCNQIESKEFYLLGKKFDIKGTSRADKEEAYAQARDWMFSIFVYPYRPFAISFPKEFIENQLDKACPSCSFYLDYSYKYTKDNQLELKVRADCGDKKTFFSNFKADFFLVNEWSCKKEK